MTHSDQNSTIRASRRDVFKYAGGAGIAAALAGAAASPSAAQTACPDIPQGAGFYKFKLGAFNCMSVNEGMLPVGAPIKQTLAPDADQAGFDAVLKNAFLPGDSAGLQCNILYVDTGRDKVLVDVGGGENFVPAIGRLADSLRNAGVGAEEITAVVFTHAHPDHIWGVADKQGKLVFPNARYFLSETEHSFWMQESPDLSGMRIPPKIRAGVIANAKKYLGLVKDRLNLVNGESEILPGITALPAFGHTPGHTGVIVSSGNETLLHAADFAHFYAAALANPDWGAAFDTIPDLAAKTRRGLLDRMAADRSLVMAFHFPFPGIGNVRTEGSGYGWVPINWSWGA